MALVVKKLLVDAGDIRDTGLTPDLGRSLGEEHANPHQYSCLENTTDRGAWSVTVHKGLKESRTQLKLLSAHTYDG